MRIEPGNNAQRISQMYKSQKILANKDNSVSKIAKDDMTLSAEARLFKDIVTAAKSAPDIRQDKIENITKAISSGLYKIDTGRIVEGLIAEVAFDQKA